MSRLTALKAKGKTPLLFNSIILDNKGSFLCGGRFNDTLTLGSTTMVERYPAAGQPHKLSDGWIGKLGYNNCNCNIAASYNITATYYGTTSFFTYTGSTNIDSLVWNWGDGTKNTYTSTYTNTISHVYAGPGHYQVCVAAYNDTCMDNQFCRMMPLAVSNTIAGGVSIYPNPATNELHIDGLAGGSAQIVSVTGHHLLDAAIQNAQQAIPIGNLPAGYYLILLRDKLGQTGQRSFIKQ